MEYLVVFALAGATLVFIVRAKRKVDRFNKISLLPFDDWLTAYRFSARPERLGIARAFLLQTLDLAERMEIVNADLRNSLEQEMRKEDPSSIVEGWLEVGMPHLKAVGCDGLLGNITARDAGVCLLIGTASVNPERDMKQFLREYRKL